VYRVSKNPYMVTLTPSEKLESGIISEEDKGKLLKVRAIKYPLPPERCVYMANGLLCCFKWRLFYLCADEPETEYYYSMTIDKYAML